MRVKERSGRSKARALTQADLALQDRIVSEFYFDPLGYVMFAFPWREPGTRLEDEDGPDEWQSQLLTDLRDKLLAGMDVADAMPLMFAVASGHGVGKTALVSWIIKWFIATRSHCEIIVTAGKRDQLSGKTWRELAKWHNMAIDYRLFHWTATKFYHVAAPETWFAHAIAWSKQAPDNFSGTHEKDVLVIFDEASAIDDVIWESTDGAMTTPGAMWFAFGNPIRNKGRFAQCFGKFRSLWNCRQVDARTAKKANRKLLDEWIRLYGEDSDFVRKRVRGIFPRAGHLQFISTEEVGRAMQRTYDPSTYREAAKVLAYDIARHGDDEIVETKRQGLRATQRAWRENVTDPSILMTIAARIAETINDWRPDAVFVDATGIGWGVIDRLRQMGHGNVIAVQTAERANDPHAFHDLGAETWFKMRQWITEGGSLDFDPVLEAQLTGREYMFDGSDRYQLQSKDDMRTENPEIGSPDRADSLALTFTAPVAAKRAKESETWRKKLRARVRAGRHGGRSPMRAQRRTARPRRHRAA